MFVLVVSAIMCSQRQLSFIWRTQPFHCRGEVATLYTCPCDVFDNFPWEYCGLDRLSSSYKILWITSVFIVDTTINSWTKPTRQVHVRIHLKITRSANHQYTHIYMCTCINVRAIVNNIYFLNNIIIENYHILFWILRKRCNACWTID